MGDLAAFTAPDIGIAAPVVRLRVVGDLAVRAALAGAALLGKIVPATAARGPHGIAVLSWEGGELGELSAVFQPYILGDGGGVMLAEVVFIAFHVFVEEGPLRVDGKSRHIEGEDLLRCRKTLSCLCRIDGLSKRETVQFAVAGERTALRVFLDIGGEVESAVGRYRERGFPSAESGEAEWGAALCRDCPDILAALAPGGEDYVLPVGSPDRLGVVGRVGGDLGGLSARCRNGEQVALIDENYPGCVGGDCILAEPAGCGLCRGRDCKHRGEKGRNYSHIANIRK